MRIAYPALIVPNEAATMSIASCSICFEDLIAVRSRGFVVPQLRPQPPVKNGTYKASDRAKTRPALTQAKTEDEKVTSSGDDDVSTTPCGHVFHTKCVSQWIKQHRHCPQCRRPTLTSGLVRLFLTEEGQTLRRSRNDLSGSVQGATALANGRSPTSTLTFDPASEAEKIKNEREEHRIIQDVLQCQLEDLEAEMHKLKKLLVKNEDHLQEKVREVSGLEMDLLTAASKTARLQRKVADRDEALRKLRDKEKDLKANADEVRASLKTEYAAVEKDNEELRAKMYKLREEARTKDLELRSRNSRIEELQGRMRQMETDLTNKDAVISQMQVRVRKTVSTLFLFRFDGGQFCPPVTSRYVFNHFRNEVAAV